MPTTKPETLRLQIGKDTLKCEKVNGEWTFSCKRWPDLSKMFDGSESAVEARAEFIRRCEEAKGIKKLPLAKARIV